MPVFSTSENYQTLADFFAIIPKGIEAILRLSKKEKTLHRDLSLLSFYSQTTDFFSSPGRTDNSQNIFLKEKADRSGSASFRKKNLKALKLNLRVGSTQITKKKNKSPIVVPSHG